MKLSATIDKLVSEGYVLKVVDNNVVNMGIKQVNTRVEDLDLSTRALNAIKRNGINTIEELIDMMNSALYRKVIRGMGNLTKKEIRNALIEWNWSNMNETQRVKYLQTIFE